MASTITTHVPAEIQAAVDRFQAASAAKDVVGMVANYAEDAVMLPPGAGIVQGRDAIRAFWQAAIDEGLEGAAVEALAVEDLGDTVIVGGNFTTYATGHRIVGQGTYLVVWRNEGGWKLHWDIWNSGRPAHP